MSKVISVLEKMASDAAMNDDSVVAELVATCDINDGQMQAIMANDVEALVESTQDLPVLNLLYLLFLLKMMKMMKMQKQTTKKVLTYQQ